MVPGSSRVCTYICLQMGELGNVHSIYQWTQGQCIHKKDMHPLFWLYFCLESTLCIFSGNGSSDVVSRSNYQ